ncbi:MAG: hypothetical protein PF481_08355 [Bacteroidales bacterium]|nr:hypothetical protein [Bacteroidales bacterium]
MDTIESVYPNVLEQKLTLSQAGVSARVYNSWKKSGVFQNTAIGRGEDQAWVRLNIYDYVWIKIIKVLRDFGVSLENIRIVKETLFKSIYDSFERNEITEMVNYQNPNMNEKEKKEAVHILEACFDEYQLLDDVNKTYTYIISTLVTRVLLFSEAPYIIVVLDGDNILPLSTSLEEVQNNKEIAEFIERRPNLKIPVLPIIEEFLQDPKNDENLYLWGFLNLKERKIIEALRHGDFKEIVIRPKHKQTDEYTIEVTTDNDIINSQVKELKKLLSLNQYSEVILKQRNDKHVYIRNKKIIN